MIWRSQAYLLCWRHNRVEEAEAGYGNQRFFWMSMQVYGFWRSIASFRVRVALRLKGLPFEEIPVDILSGYKCRAGGAHVYSRRPFRVPVARDHRISRRYSAQPAAIATGCKGPRLCALAGAEDDCRCASPGDAPCPQSPRQDVWRRCPRNRELGQALDD